MSDVVLSAGMGMPLAVGEDRDQFVSQGSVVLGYVRVSCSSCVVKGPCVLKLSFFRIPCLSDFSSWRWWCEITTNSYSEYFWSMFPPPAVLSTTGVDQGNSKYMNETQTTWKLSDGTTVLSFGQFSNAKAMSWVLYREHATVSVLFCL